MSGADEFALIRRHFAPLAGDPAARGLLDDAALLPTTGAPLVLTTDSIVEAVHFLPDDPIATVAQKALRVNLSDLAAKGAEPVGYLLTLFWPDARPAAEIEAFAAGLAADQARFGLALLGGDTVATPGPLCVTITAIGRPLGRAPDRRDGEAGDQLWVSGPIGDGRLGLEAARGALSQASPADAAWLCARYRTPEPRLDLAGVVARWASASMDVSDGLLADAAKLAEASGLGVVIERAAVPVSGPAARVLAGGGWSALDLLSGGDDYQILLSAPAAAAPALEAAGFTRIGALTAAPGLVLREPDGTNAPVPTAGFTHRLGR